MPMTPCVPLNTYVTYSQVDVHTLTWLFVATWDLQRPFVECCNYLCDYSWPISSLNSESWVIENLKVILQLSWNLITSFIMELHTQHVKNKTDYIATRWILRITTNWHAVFFLHTYRRAWNIGSIKTFTVYSILFAVESFCCFHSLIMISNCKTFPVKRFQFFILTINISMVPAK